MSETDEVPAVVATLPFSQLLHTSLKRVERVAFACAYHLESGTLTVDDLRSLRTVIAGCLAGMPDVEKIPRHFDDNGRPLCGAARVVNARTKDGTRVDCVTCRERMTAAQRSG